MTAARIVFFCLIALARPAAADPHRVYLRGGVIHLTRFSDSRPIELSGVDGAASLALMDGPIEGSGTTVDPITSPGLIIGYLTPLFGDRLAIETVVAPPLHLRFRGTGTLADESIAPDALGIPTGVPALGPELGEAKGAPIVLLASYRILGGEALQPYVGMGPTVLFAYNERLTNPTLTEAGQPQLQIHPAAGLVLQGGLDARIWRRLRGRIDFKYVAFMTARATVENIKVRTPELPLFEAVDVGTAKMAINVNPLVVLVGVGADFW